MIFVCLSEEHETGLPAYLDQMTESHVFAPGFCMTVNAPADLVIENAFDNSHFRPVHRVTEDPVFAVRASEHGEFAADGALAVPSSSWQRVADQTTVSVPFLARAFSPNLVITEMGGEFPYTVITAATPLAPRVSEVRLSMAIPLRPEGPPPSADSVQYLLRQSRAGLDQDRAIWDRMLPIERPAYAPEDAVALKFRQFCKRFADAQ